MLREAERGRQFLSVHWLKVWPLSSSEVNTWVLEGHKDVSVPIATRCGSQPPCSCFLNAGSHKGESTIAEMTFSVAPEVYSEALHSQWSWWAQWAEMGSVRCWHYAEWWLGLGRGVPCCTQLQEHAEHTQCPAVRTAGSGHAGPPLFLWLSGKDRIRPTNFLPCAVFAASRFSSMCTDRAAARFCSLSSLTPIFSWINNIAYIKINLSWV